ncbi:GntR family transcriptional regulator (plasmid) [Actinoplanes sp. CA-051413]|uniref:GntR family transcriptional regulator n=1 Tax=Actinoplanes sp. CA-051413 TaxID=3239899 RepID=UPI003D99A1F1
MSTGPTDARPLQVRVADDLRMEIETGRYAPGQKLPTLDELAEVNLCSLAVARKAMDLLRQQGLVVTQQGKGTFVRERPSARRHGIDRYSKSRWRSGKPILTAEAEAQGHTAGQMMRELGVTPAPEKVAERFDIPVGTPVWVRRRTTLVDDRPNQLADSYYELDVVDGTLIKEEQTGPGGGFARLEDVGKTRHGDDYELDEICEEWSVRMPTGPEGVALRLPAGTPVIDLIRTTYDSMGRAVEIMLAVMAGDMVKMAYKFKIPD